MYRLIEILGIMTIVLLFFNVLGGLLLRKLKLKLIYHKTGAIITLLAGIAHYVLILIYY